MRVKSLVYGIVAVVLWRVAHWDHHRYGGMLNPNPERYVLPALVAYKAVVTFLRGL